MENCGLFAVCADRPCVDDLYYGLIKLQHRGQRYCGIATGDGCLRLHTHRGFVRHTFTPGELAGLVGDKGLAHVSMSERQPLMLDSRLGPFCLAFSGFISNAVVLEARLKDRGFSFATGGQAELLAKLVVQGSDFAAGLAALAGQVKGSYAIAVLTPAGVYAARDRHGLKPLILGRRPGALAVASESRPFNLTGFAIERDVAPGEVVFFDRRCWQTRALVPAARRAHCAFEWAYIASMDSVLDGVPVVTVRNRLGRSLARRYAVDADLVSAVPFSGVGYALGYHQESGIPYDEAFLFDRFSSRSYLPASQGERELEARVKLSVVQAVVAGRRIVLCDDSIVRGTQIRDKVRELKAAGAREVHVRVGCPPLLHPCRYDNATRSYRELAARRHPVAGIAALIGADSLEYNTLDDFVRGIGFPRDQLCLACWEQRRPLAGGPA